MHAIKLRSHFSEFFGVDDIEQIIPLRPQAHLFRPINLVHGLGEADQSGLAGNITHTIGQRIGVSGGGGDIDDDSAAFVRHHPSGKLADEKVKVRIIHSGVGAVNESDVLLASASNAIIIAFNVRPDRNAEEIANRERVDIRQHSVIYNVTDEMKKAMTGLLDPTFKEVRIGVAQVRDTFKVPKFGTIAGCLVTEGRITRSGDTQARLLRDNVVVYEGKIGSLRRFKDDAGEVKAGLECGIGFDKFNDLKVGDVIEVFTMERVAITA